MGSGVFNHTGHLFECGKSQEVEWSTTGYAQNVRCVVCDEVLWNIDCEYLQVRATKADIKAALAIINAKNKTLLAARKALTAKL